MSLDAYLRDQSVVRVSVPRPAAPSAPPPPEPGSSPVMTARGRWPEHFAPPLRQETQEDSVDAAEEGGGGGDAPRGYRVRSEETWAAAREDYEIGFSAEVICDRMNLGLSAFRQRARREGWRREDQAEGELIPPSLRDEPPPLPANYELGPPPAPPTADLADLAWRSAAEAVRRGEVYKARAWFKLHDELQARVREDDKAARRALAEAAIDAEDAAAAAALEAAQALPQDALAPDAGLHGLHPKDSPRVDLQALMDRLTAKLAREARIRKAMAALGPP